MHTVTIYQGTHAVADITRPDFRSAWRDAVRAVRSLAHGAGGFVGVEITAPKGRARYQAGDFSALPMHYVRPLVGLPCA